MKYPLWSYVLLSQDVWQHLHQIVNFSDFRVQIKFLNLSSQETEGGKVGGKVGAKQKQLVNKGRAV